MRTKVLLVDDVKFFLELERSFLDREGFEVLTADSGPAALVAARRERPDLVLLDLNMPVMGGDEVCRALKRDPQTGRIPVIMVTSGQKEEDLERCRAAGCDGFLRKPLNQVELLETIGRFLKTQVRVAPRIPVRVPVTLVVLDKDRTPAGAPIEAATVDVGVGGLYVERLDPLPIGTPVSVTFTLPEFTAPVRAQAVVVWVNRPFDKLKGTVPAGMGLRFVDLPQSVRAVLELFVSRSLAARRGKS
ncbi:MAG TPA: response regulator [Thermodesulfobacteriota bacterium]